MENDKLKQIRTPKAKTKFILRNPKAKTEQPIYLLYRFGSNDKLLYPTKFKIHKKFWNSETCRVRDLTEVLNKDIINNRLNELFGAVELHKSGLKAKGQELTKDSLRKFLNDLINHNTTDDNSFFGFIDKFTKQAESRMNPKTGQIICYKQKREYERTYYYLKEFVKKKNRPLNWDDITLDFYSNFIEFLQSLKLSTNTIAHKIQTLKIFLNEATERGVNSNMQYKSHRFKAITEESENVYLDEKELKALYKYDFSNNERWERTRDLFLIGCYTGLRFSDFTRITSDSIKNGMIQIRQQKTNAKVLIPCHPIFNAIWAKYEGQLPKQVSNQKFNVAIKEVCEKAKINEPFYKSITKGGIKQTKKYEKHQLVSSHSARRSFATNLYKSGFPSISIMQITGHKTEAAFLKYIKVTPDEHAKLLALHWAKSNSHLKVV